MGALSRKIAVICLRLLLDKAVLPNVIYNMRGLMNMAQAQRGGIPEWPKGADCKSVVSDFDGSNPSPSTTKPGVTVPGFFTLRH